MQDDATNQSCSINVGIPKGILFGDDAERAMAWDTCHGIFLRARAGDFVGDSPCRKYQRIDQEKNETIQTIQRKNGQNDLWNLVEVRSFWSNV